MVQDDGKVRLVLRDWPILGPVSVVAARMALASKYQDKYDKAHDAMIGVSSKLTEPRVYELLAGAGVDVDRAKADLAANAKRNDRRMLEEQQQIWNAIGASLFDEFPLEGQRLVVTDQAKATNVEPAHVQFCDGV